MSSQTNIRQSFTGENGKFDPIMFASYLSQVRIIRTLTKALKCGQWLSFENAVANQANTFKFNNAVEKALFMPSSLVWGGVLGANAQYHLRLCTLYRCKWEWNWSERIGRKEILPENKDNFTQKDGRNIEFINFPLAPSQAGRDALQSESVISTGMVSAEDDSVFVNLHSDIRFVPEYFTVDELMGTSLDTLVDGQDVGCKETHWFWWCFCSCEIGNKKILADSVQARHILIRSVQRVWILVL